MRPCPARFQVPLQCFGMALGARAGLSVGIEIDDSALVLDYRFAVPGLIWPPAGTAARRDGIWQASCAELFVAWGDGTYREFNFAADGSWATYDFGGHRQMSDALPSVPAPGIEFTDHGTEQVLRVSLEPARHFVGRYPKTLGISAVTATPAELAYWALRHPAARPDFHDAAGFAWVWPFN